MTSQAKDAGGLGRRRGRAAQFGVQSPLWPPEQRDPAHGGHSPLPEYLITLRGVVRGIDPADFGPHGWDAYRTCYPGCRPCSRLGRSLTRTREGTTIVPGQPDAARATYYGGRWDPVTNTIAGGRWRVPKHRGACGRRLQPGQAVIGPHVHWNGRYDQWCPWAEYCSRPSCRPAYEADALAERRLGRWLDLHPEYRCGAEPWPELETWSEDEFERFLLGQPPG